VSTAFLLLRVTASLAVVVVLALVAARFTRRSGRGRHSGTDVRVCERVGLTRDAAAVVVEVDGRRLLLGVTTGAVSVLADLGRLDDPAALEAGRVVVADSPAAPPALREYPPRRAAAPELAIPRPRTELVGGATVRVTEVPLSRKAIRHVEGRRRPAVPPTQRGTGSVLDPRTWQQGLEALRDLTARRG